MQHLKNIEKLFSKNFVESPLLDSFEVGNITITSGQLVACDPLTTSGMQAFSTQFPVGEFPVLVHKERTSNCLAYVEIVFKNTKAKNWKMATLENQNIDDLKGEEIFGYPVESGMGCFMDFETQTSLQHLEQKIFEEKGEAFLGIYEEYFHSYFFENSGAINQFSFLIPNESKNGNIFAFETGFGEGFYASYIGFDDENKPVKIISEFIEIES